MSLDPLFPTVMKQLNLFETSQIDARATWILYKRRAVLKNIYWQDYFALDFVKRGDYETSLIDLISPHNLRVDTKENMLKSGLLVIIPNIPDSFRKYSPLSVDQLQKLSRTRRVKKTNRRVKIFINV